MAIALFPPNEGETLGSCIGRYAQYMGLNSTVVLRRLLFGYTCSPGTRLPSAMSYFAEQTRDYWNMSGEAIIRRHTEFQYVTMMAPNALRDRLLLHLLDSRDSRRTIMRFGGGLKREVVKKLRYCEECLSEWRSKNIMPFWKIDHQLPGAYYCHLHSCVLKMTGQQFAKNVLDPTVLSLRRDSDEAVLKRVSSVERDAIMDVTIRSVRQRIDGDSCRRPKTYRELLVNAGFARPDGTISRTALIRNWLGYFGPEYCHLTGMDEQKIGGWSRNISRCASARQFPQPFIFVAAHSFLDHCCKFPGSFVPALHSAGTNQEVHSPEGEDTIRPDVELPECNGVLHRIGDSLHFAGRLRRSGGWKVVCSCGMSYRAKDESKRGSMCLKAFAYGPRYRRRFCAFMAKGDNYIRAGRKLNMPKSTALAWAREEGYVRRVETMPPADTRKLRATWRRTVESAPLESRITSACQINPGVYKALHRRDRAWLLSFNHEHRSWRPGASYNAAGKESTCNRVREAMAAVMQMDPPVRATRAKIFETAGLTLSEANSRKSTSILLRTLTEPRQDYLERVILWLETLAASRRLGDWEDAVHLAGLHRRSFTKEQMSRIRRFL
ncbi:TnsD family transposase [Paraburkholderia sp. HP33-1]|uniref:TnsD family transposase n=1 Tax=Paraburkholderia sp. HP33-1 TaxID=2883243 RepID=UPI001F488F0A|nr:TnsD family transposase [Paraburkholderia sp. HP33-1]